MGMLYERCPQCDAGQVRPPVRNRPDGTCFACAGRLYVPIGLHSAQLERLMIALRAYIRNTMERNSAFETGHYYVLLRDRVFAGDDPDLLVEQAVSALAAGEAQ